VLSDFIALSASIVEEYRFDAVQFVGLFFVQDELVDAENLREYSSCRWCSIANGDCAMPLRPC
jgi:hypothetical protein